MRNSNLPTLLASIAFGALCGFATQSDGGWFRHPGQLCQGRSAAGVEYHNGAHVPESFTSNTILECPLTSSNTQPFGSVSFLNVHVSGPGFADALTCVSFYDTAGGACSSTIGKALSAGMNVMQPSVAPLNQYAQHFGYLMLWLPPGATVVGYSFGS